MMKNPDISIKIICHTEDIGDKQFNLQLSNDRAYSVKKFLSINGIDNNRIESVDYGFTKPVSKNNIQINQGVKLIILNK